MPKKKLEPLTPPDLTRCQAMITTHRPFILGGNPRKTERCDNVPTVIVTENKPGKDGSKGSMSLCESCLDVISEENPKGIKSEKIPLKPCVIKSHFTCDGTGQMCGKCGESESACGCDEQDLENCEECEGAGKLCVEHDSPCGDLSKNPKCDVAKKASKR